MDDIVRRVDDLEKSCQSFFKSNLSLLCFLSGDKSDRYKTAKAVLEISGAECGKAKAKEWLSAKDREVKELLKAEKIEIN